MHERILACIINLLEPGERHVLSCKKLVEEHLVIEKLTGQGDRKFHHKTLLLSGGRQECFAARHCCLVADDRDCIIVWREMILSGPLAMTSYITFKVNKDGVFHP